MSNIFNSILINEQHGFCAEKLIITNLLVYYSYLIQEVSCGKQVDVVYTDLKKAFETVDHNILINKLKLVKLIGVNDPLLSCIYSYLTYRVQMIKVGSSISNLVSISSGVLQGGHLSPLLFLIVINDIGKVFRYCKFSLFAEDLFACVFSF